MLAALILAAHLTAATPSHGVGSSSPVPVSHHVKHVRHDKHLAHLHRLHELHSQRSPRSAQVPMGPGQAVPVHVNPALSGHLGCTGLEALWVSAGGAKSSAFIAAEIAEAESGGNQYATGAVGERGYWQINPNHGSLSTYDPYGNARAAVIISDDGRDWSAWTTFTSGAYLGRCLPSVA
jgi:hypothetical protein